MQRVIVHIADRVSDATIRCRFPKVGYGEDTRDVGYHKCIRNDPEPFRCHKSCKYVLLILVLSHFACSPTCTGNNDEARVHQLMDVLGTALVTTLSTIERENQLTPHSKFLDLELIMGCFMEIFHDLPAVVNNGSCQLYLIKAIEYFKKGNLDSAKGVFGTKEHLNNLESLRRIFLTEPDREEEVEENTESRRLSPTGTDEDPWQWQVTMEAYKVKYRESIKLRKENELVQQQEPPKRKGRGRRALGELSVN